MREKGINEFKAKLTKLQDTLRRIVPQRIAANAERHFKESFRKQGFTDGGFQRWRPTKKGKPGRVLKKSGLLMNSVKAVAVGMTIRVTAGGPQVPYAKIHNEGGTIQGQVTRRAHFRKASKTKRGQTRKAAFVRRHQARLNVHLPKRQFIGPSRTLNATMTETIRNTIRAVMKPR